ncbi:hypothetical protein ACWGHM_43005 [Streptomyces sp. NPDC054904]
MVHVRPPYAQTARGLVRAEAGVPVEQGWQVPAAGERPDLLPVNALLWVLAPTALTTANQPTP